MRPSGPGPHQAMMWGMRRWRLPMVVCHARPRRCFLALRQQGCLVPARIPPHLATTLTRTHVPFPPCPGRLLHLLHAHHRVPAGVHPALPVHLDGQRRLRAGHPCLLHRIRHLLQARPAFMLRGVKGIAGPLWVASCVVCGRGISCTRSPACTATEVGVPRSGQSCRCVQAHARGAQPLLPAHRGGGD